MNSSVENSIYDSSRLQKVYRESESENRSIPANNCVVSTTNFQYLEVPQNKNGKKERNLKSKAVSTPIKRITTNNPFKCTLSPIGAWDLQHFNNNFRNRNRNEDGGVGFNATPVNDIIVNVEYVGDADAANIRKEVFINSLEISPLALVRERWKSKNKKNVCFAENYISANTTEKVNVESDITSSQLCPKLDLQPGKWQRSVNCYRRTLNCLTGKPFIYFSYKYKLSCLHYLLLFQYK